MKYMTKSALTNRKLMTYIANTHQSVAQTKVVEKNLDVIPAIYPKSMRIKNNKLFPFVLLDLIDFIKLNGQLMPNKINIVASKIFATNIPFLPYNSFQLYHS